MVHTIVGCISHGTVGAQGAKAPPLPQFLTPTDCGPIEKSLHYCSDAVGDPVNAAEGPIFQSVLSHGCGGGGNQTCIL